MIKQILCHLYTAPTSYMWSNAASISQKKTIRLRILQIWWCFYTSNEHDVGNMGFQIRFSVVWFFNKALRLQGLVKTSWI